MPACHHRVLRVEIFAERLYCRADPVLGDANQQEIVKEWPFMQKGDCGLEPRRKRLYERA